MEAAALGLLTAAYFDSKHRIYTDLLNVRSLAHATISYAIAERRGRLNLIDTLQYYASKRPNHKFILYPEPEPSGFKLEGYTYAEVLDIVMRYSRFLNEEHGIKPNDVVALDFVNKPEFVFVWFALWNLGAVPAMINYNLQGKSLIHCVLTSKAKLFIVDDEVQLKGLTAKEELDKHNVPILVVSKQSFTSVIDQFKPKKQIKVRNVGSDPAVYIFTSGTTGLPKAANFSWKKSYYGSILFGDVSYYSKNDIMYSAMPLYHSTAAVLGLMAILQKGGTYAIGHKFSTSTFWQQVRLCNANSIQYVGETCRYLLNAPPTKFDKDHNVRVAHGNGMRPDVWEKFKTRFNIPVVSEFYAATETPFSLTNYQQGNFGIGACASYGTLATLVLKRSRWQLVRIDMDTYEFVRNSSGHAVPAREGEVGELLFKVNARNIKADFQGYEGNTKASNEKIALNVFKKGDAWIRSGDLLKFDGNNNVYFVDRLGDTFRWKSENVSTNEVEEAIGELANVDVVVCVGVKVPKHEGRAGFAVVKLVNNNVEMDMNVLAQHLLKRLPRYAVPVFIKFVNVIERTGNNKIQKKAFRDQKIPSNDEVIYWLVGDKYVKLTGDQWAKVEGGRHKL